MFCIHILCPAGHLKTIQANPDFFSRGPYKKLFEFFGTVGL